MIRITGFDKALQIVLSWEGGYVNDPHDPGGETNYGICKKSYPNIDIKKLTLNDAADIYRKDYWLKCLCDELPLSVAIVVFDTAVNMGPNAAISLLQKSLDVAADGIIGPFTLSAAKGGRTYDLLVRYMANRITKYTELDGWKRYGLGWTKRVISVFGQAITA
jgi:lysozyme family protein